MLVGSGMEGHGESVFSPIDETRRENLDGDMCFHSFISISANPLTSTSDDIWESK